MKIYRLNKTKENQMSKKRKRRKCDAMYRKYGEHSPGVFCGGCCNCQK